jgi:hypothetical protein
MDLSGWGGNFAGSLAARVVEVCAILLVDAAFKESNHFLGVCGAARNDGPH